MNIESIFYLRMMFEKLWKYKRLNDSIWIDSYYHQLIGFIDCLYFTNVISKDVKNKIRDVAINISIHGRTVIKCK